MTKRKLVVLAIIAMAIFSGAKSITDSARAVILDGQASREAAIEEAVSGSIDR